MDKIRKQINHYLAARERASSLPDEAYHRIMREELKQVFTCYNETGAGSLASRNIMLMFLNSLQVKDFGESEYLQRFDYQHEYAKLKKANLILQAEAPLISIIVPVYNAGKYIEQLLDSMLMQSFREIEVILVDGGSSDGSQKIVKNFQTADSRVRLINQPNAGPGAARTLGVSEARGRYVVFADADDFLCDGALETMYSCMEIYQVDMCEFTFYMCSEKGEMLYDGAEHSFMDEIYLPRSHTFNAASVPNFIFQLMNTSVWAKIFKTDFIKKCIALEKDYKQAEDVFTAIKTILQADRVVFLPKPVYVYRQTGGECRSTRFLKEPIEVVKIFADLHGFIESINQDPAVLRSWLNRAWKRILDLLEGMETEKTFLKLYRYLWRTGLQEMGFRKLPVRAIDYEQKAYTIYRRMMQLGDSVKNKDELLHPFVKDLGGNDKMLVYGVGDHLFDMLNWYPELGGKIARVFDKNEKKIGQKVPGLDIVIEPPKALASLPEGTQVAIAAIRYYDDIVSDIRNINPGLILPDIDDAYAMMQKYSEENALSANQEPQEVQELEAPVEEEAPCHNDEEVQQLLKGQAAHMRWRQRFIMECLDCRCIYWGVRGSRPAYLRRQFAPMMRAGDIMIDEDDALKGTMQDGLPVCTPNALKDVSSRYRIIVLTEEYDKVRDKLLSYGYVENVDFAEGRRLLGEDEQGLLDLR